MIKTGSTKKDPAILKQPEEGGVLDLKLSDNFRVNLTPQACSAKGKSIDEKGVQDQESKTGIFRLLGYNTITTKKIVGLRGTLSTCRGLPGDKSISHRALVFGALAQGDTFIEGLNTGEDVEQTQNALKNMGVKMSEKRGKVLLIKGTPTGYLDQPSTPLYLGNSGTSARLLCGLVASQKMTVTFYGDSSLRCRPMQRVITPLRAMGARFSMGVDASLPLTVTGAAPVFGTSYTMPIPSAQVKTAIMIAGLKATGTTEIIEPVGTRDHTERLLTYMGYPIDCQILPNKSHRIQLPGNQPLVGRALSIPADSSAAAFITVAALITPQSHVRLEGVCWNPFRNVIFRVLQSMGAAITVTNNRVICGEPVADLEVMSSSLKPIHLDKELSVPLIDEYPILSIAAAYAPGVSEFHGLSELRYKESDRLTAIAKGLEACGVLASIKGDSLRIHGQKTIFGGANIKAHKDHRIAVSFYILGMVSQNPVMIYGAETIKTSFPEFLKSVDQLAVLG